MIAGIEWPIIVGIALYSGLEYWLGKTDKVKPGSVIEAVGYGIKAAAGTVLSSKSKSTKLELPKK